MKRKDLLKQVILRYSCRVNKPSLNRCTGCMFYNSAGDYKCNWAIKRANQLEKKWGL